MKDSIFTALLEKKRKSKTKISLGGCSDWRFNQVAMEVKLKWLKQEKGQGFQLQ